MAIKKTQIEVLNSNIKKKYQPKALRRARQIDLLQQMPFYRLVNK